MDLKDKIKTIPGAEGWWKSSGEDSFNMWAKHLMEKGFSESEAVGILQDVYWSVAEEFGN